MVFKNEWVKVFNPVARASERENGKMHQVWCFTLNCIRVCTFISSLFSLSFEAVLQRAHGASEEHGKSFLFMLINDLIKKHLPPKHFVWALGEVRYLTGSVKEQKCGSFRGLAQSAIYSELCNRDRAIGKVLIELQEDCWTKHFRTWTRKTWASFCLPFIVKVFIGTVSSLLDTQFVRYISLDTGAASTIHNNPTDRHPNPAILWFPNPHDDHAVVWPPYSSSVQLLVYGVDASIYRLIHERRSWWCVEHTGAQPSFHTNWEWRGCRFVGTLTVQVWQPSGQCKPT